MLEHLTLEAFASHIGETFGIQAEQGRTVSLELVEATDLNAGVSTAKGEGPNRGDSFSLVFRAPAELPPAQGTYHLEHGELGAFALFLVPIGADRLGNLLEAVVNRLPPSGATP